MPFAHLSHPHYQGPFKARHDAQHRAGDAFAYASSWHQLPSHHLGREVAVEIIQPASWPQGRALPLLVLNDGQDNAAVQIKQCLERETSHAHIRPLLAVGVVAGDRMAEYGTAFRADYKGRGAKAKQYNAFLLEELLPWLHKHYLLSTEPKERAIAGYSLGGLSAADTAWNHPDVFRKCGAFSGSFWWRRYTIWERILGMDHGRLMHLQVRKSKRKPTVKFWFQAGTHDEESDRNNNGIIDAIDDTLDLMVEMSRKGMRPYDDYTYYEMHEGRHDTATWREAMPHFLRWAFAESKHHMR